MQSVKPSGLVEEVAMAMVSGDGSVLAVKSSDSGLVSRIVTAQIQWRWRSNVNAPSRSDLDL